MIIHLVKKTGRVYELDLIGYNKIMNFLRLVQGECDNSEKKCCVVSLALNGICFATACQDFLCLPEEIRAKLKKT